MGGIIIDKGRRLGLQETANLLNDQFSRVNKVRAERFQPTSNGTWKRVSNEVVGDFGAGTITSEMLIRYRDKRGKLLVASVRADSLEVIENNGVVQLGWTGPDAVPVIRKFTR